MLRKLNIGANISILRGGGEDLQAAEKVETVMFDKTRTISMRKPRVKAVTIIDEGSNRLQDQESIISENLIIL